MEKEPLAKEKRKGMHEEGQLMVVNGKKRSLGKLGNTKSMEGQKSFVALWRGEINKL